MFTGWLDHVFVLGTLLLGDPGPQRPALVVSSPSGGNRGYPPTGRKKAAWGMGLGIVGLLGSMILKGFIF